MMVLKLFGVAKVPKEIMIALAVIAGILLIFLIANSNTILTSLGFDTATSLKGQLVASQASLQQATDVNTDLSARIKELEKRHTEELLAIELASKENERLHVIYNTNITVHDKNHAKLVSALEAKIKVLQNTNSVSGVPSTDILCIPIAEYNALSNINIELVHKIYNNVFKGETK